MMMGTLLENLHDWVSDTERTLQRMQGDPYTAALMRDMLVDVAPVIDTIDFGDDKVTRRGVTLMCLGELPGYGIRVGEVSVGRALYVGADAKVYIEGPRNRRGTTVIDIHPYDVSDAKGWGGISANQIITMLSACFI